MPLLVPFARIEEIMSIPPAQDGQYKARVKLGAISELFVNNAGGFNVDAYFGWNEFNTPIESTVKERASSLTHSQVQTLLGAIGHAKGNDVWVPMGDRALIDWSVTEQFPFAGRLPQRFRAIEPILSEIDVVWTRRGGSDLVALFEIEHSTTVYSGLLRFNDVHLASPDAATRFSIVANDERRSLFVRQINRPTFQRSGLSELCTFMEYENVLGWHGRARRSLK